MSLLTRLLRPSVPAPAAPTPADHDLVRATRASRLADAQQALAAGGSPNRVLVQEGSEYTAFNEAIRRHNAALVQVFLDHGFRPRPSDVEQAVREVEQKPDFDGHPGEMPAGHDVIRVLFAHGERFSGSSHDPRFPTESLADNLRRHAPSLRLDWTSPVVVPWVLHPERPPARSPAEREQLNRWLGVRAFSQNLASLDEIRHLLDRGADPLRVPREIGPSSTLTQVAVEAVEPYLLRFCLHRGLWPSAEEKAYLVNRLWTAHNETDERRNHGSGLSSAHTLIRVLLAHGETFADLAPSEAQPHQTAADVIRARSPILAQELPEAKPAPNPSEPASERRRYRR
jgi:hypothetical protein